MGSANAVVIPEVAFPALEFVGLDLLDSVCSILGISSGEGRSFLLLKPRLVLE